MTVATAEAINAAKTSLDSWLAYALRGWLDGEERATHKAKHAQIHEHLHDALTAATTPKALGCVSEDGTVPPASHG